MLYLKFQLQEQHYAIKTQYICDIIPNIPLQQVAESPDHLAGLLSLRGRILPVIDFSLWLQQKACRPVLSTRIAIIQDPTQALPRFGLQGEQMLYTFDDKQLLQKPQDIPSKHCDWLGQILQYDKQWVQVIEPLALLNTELADCLATKQYA